MGAELVDLGGIAQAGPEQLTALCTRFALDMDPASVPDLVRRFGLRFPAAPLALSQGMAGSHLVS